MKDDDRDLALAALRFIADISLEQLGYSKIGTGDEVALRHIFRRAEETLRRLEVVRP